jgi:phytoene/squalene synthetase
MDQYTQTCYQLARTVTVNYSTSFSKSSRLFSSEIRNHIYAIYGLVRVADEVVDTYQGKDKLDVIKNLEAQTLYSLKTGFSPNPLVHAYVTTARQYGIGQDLIQPFFESMQMDIEPQTYTPKLYSDYIYGSSEVIGLMCLKVFCSNDAQYKKLEAGAKALGSAYQKVNFLRDLKADYDERGRVYFPGITFNAFNDTQKDDIIEEIKKDFKKAQPAVAKLPANARAAVALSFTYYSELLNKLERTPAEQIKAGRVRVTNAKKMQLLIKTRLKKGTV